MIRDNFHCVGGDNYHVILKTEITNFKMNDSFFNPQ
jgi:hypothetical protein